VSAPITPFARAMQSYKAAVAARDEAIDRLMLRLIVGDPAAHREIDDLQMVVDAELVALKAHAQKLGIDPDLDLAA